MLPGAKQGIHDQRWWDAHGLSAALAAAAEGGGAASPSSSSAAAGTTAATALLYPNPPLDRLPAAARDRYAAYDLVSPGVKRYNVWWASHETVYPPPKGLFVPGGGGARGEGRANAEAATPSSSSSSSSPSRSSGGGSGSRNVAVASAAVSSSSLSRAESGAVLADAAAAAAATAAAKKAAPSSSSSCPEGSFLWPASERHRAAVNASRHHCYDSRQDAILQGYLALDAAHGVQSYATVWKAPAAARHPGCAGFDNGNGGSEKSPANSSSSSAPPNREYGGCAPNLADPQALADFADFVAYLADRHRLSGGGFLARQQQQQQQRKAGTTTSSSGSSIGVGTGAGGGFAGFIIWNEAASALWFDTSPLISPASGALRDQSQAERWADAYAALLEAAERSLRAVGARPALVLASLDTLWASPGEKGPIYQSSSPSAGDLFPLGGIHAGRAHLGSGNLVEALWRRLGTRVDWSLAVHPYGAPIAPGNKPSSSSPSSSSSSPPLLQLLPPILHFSDLRRLSDLQAQRAAEAPSKILGVRVGADKGSRAPQALVAATEQGWPSSGAKGAPAAAAAICEAHSTVAVAHSSPSSSSSSSSSDSPLPQEGIVGVAFVTHNDFQGVSKGDPTGLIPNAAGPALRSLEPGASPTLSAYASTRVGVWNEGSGHYCCAVVGLGCGGGGGRSGGGAAR